MKVSKKKANLKRSENPNSSGIKKAYWYWLLSGLLVTFIIFVLLLLYRPADFTAPNIADEKQVSQYVTHILGPGIYNYAQRQEPFDLVILREKTKDIVALYKWPRQFNGIRFSAPEVSFVPGRVVLMGTVLVGGAELAVTVVLEPALDQTGLLNLRVIKAKVGAVNVTPLVRAIARRMYQLQPASSDTDTEKIHAQIAASLLNDEPFEPVFKIDDKKVRIRKITITPEKLIIRLVPVSD